MDRGDLYGEWGTKSQCARTLITPKGTKFAAPFDIKPDWLGHGEVWCRLIWSTEETTEDGLFAVARAICGEDAARDYTINFRLRGDKLTLKWSFQFTNGPLMRCNAR